MKPDLDRLRDEDRAAKVTHPIIISDMAHDRKTVAFVVETLHPALVELQKLCGKDITVHITTAANQEKEPG